MSHSEIIIASETGNLRANSGASSQTKTIRKYRDRNDEKVITYPNNDDATDRVTLTWTDMRSLSPGEFLNDNIVSLYLKYVTEEILPREMSQRLHVFNTFFYSKIKLALQKKGPFDRIRRWTRHVELFHKDFLVIPVCENHHWVLAIVCYAQQVSDPNEVVDIEIDDISHIPSSQNGKHTESIKRPAIVIMDSLRRGYISRFTPPIREFLRDECQHRTNVIKDYNRKIVKELWAKVPKQPNSFDCGIFILQFFESFFKNPDKMLRRIFGGEDLSSWFRDEELQMGGKRKQIRTLIMNMSNRIKEKKLSEPGRNGIVKQ